jgi:hypothetical protein
MKSFTYKCVTLATVCEYCELDYSLVIDAVSNSDISFGTNYDTIITGDQLEDILEDAGLIIDGLEYDSHDEDGPILISLGS